MYSKKREEAVCLQMRIQLNKREQ